MDTKTSKTKPPREPETPEARTPHAATTPDSVTDREKSRLDDEAVERAVTIDPRPAASGATSIFPGPPVPPASQAAIKKGETPQPSGHTQAPDRPAEDTAQQKQKRRRT